MFARPRLNGNVGAGGAPQGRSKGDHTPNRETATTTAPSLALLDRRSIAVQLATPNGQQVLQGVGAYEYDPDLGAVLRVAVSDGVTSYDLLFVETRWTGSIESGEAHGCDYLLRVG